MEISTWSGDLLLCDPTWKYKSHDVNVLAFVRRISTSSIASERLSDYYYFTKLSQNKAYRLVSGCTIFPRILMITAGAIADRTQNTDRQRNCKHVDSDA